MCGGREVGREDLCDPPKKGQGMRGCCSKWSAVEIGVRLGIYLRGKEGEVKICS